MKGKLDSLKEPGMGRRPKKLIGTALLVFMVPFYALVVAALASSRLAETSQFVQIAFFAFFGRPGSSPLVRLFGGWPARDRNRRVASRSTEISK